MKSITVQYFDSGLNSRRLILNAIIDIMESHDQRGIVNVSPEVCLKDVENWMNQYLTYSVNSGIMTSKNFKTGQSTTFLQAFLQ